MQITPIRLVLADKRETEKKIKESGQSVVPKYYRLYREMKNREDALSELTAGFLLSKYLNVFSDSQLIYGKYGKPALADSAEYFSVSHTDNLVVLAISKAEIGVDIERFDEVNWIAAKQVFPNNWISQLRSAGKADGDKLFIRMWTSLEAVLKAEGTGFAITKEKQWDILMKWQTKDIEFQDYLVTCAARCPAEIEVTYDNIRE